MTKEPYTTWERFTAKMAVLGIDPLGPPLGEDDPRYDDFQAILAEFGGVPLPPLPPNWEGPRPVDYDGSFAGIGRWLDFEQRQIIAQDIFPGAGQNLAHLNSIIRNAHRAFVHFQVAAPPKRKGRATEIVVAKQRIEGLVAFVQSKLESGWQSPTTDQPKVGRIEIARWRELGIGIDEDWTYYAFTLCPENGQRVRLRDGKPVPLKGKTRWPKVLPCFARSDDGKTADKGELLLELGYAKRGEIKEDAALADGLITKAKNPFRRLTVTMADLGEILRDLIAVTDTDTTTIFESRDKIYQAAFVTRHLFRDDDGYVTFGRLQ